MTLVEIILLALALAVDAFTVGSAVGLTCGKPRQIFRLSLHFGVFQALMPLIGVLFGYFLAIYIHKWDHWIVFVILIALGLKMIYSALWVEDKSARVVDLTKGMSLVSLSAAVSIDALAAGISLPAANAPVALTVGIIGGTASILTAIGMILAGKMKGFIGKGGEAIAGLVLIGLGVKAVM